MVNFSEILYLIAAKSDRFSVDGKKKWLSFVSHSLDTAGIIQKLFNRWLPEHIKMFLSEDLCRLVALLHDIGKITPAFQRKITKNIDGHSEALMNFGLNVMDLNPDLAKKSPHPLAGQVILNEAGFPKEISIIIGSHHGRSNADLIDIRQQMNVLPQNYFEKNKKQIWESLWHEWINYSLNQTGFTIETLPKPDVKTQILLTGLLIMADWISSNENYFPYTSFEERFFNSEDYPERFNIAWKKLGLPKILDINECRTPQDFKDRFSFTPNFVQEKFMTAASQNFSPGIYILEAPMGFGKTEAALTAAEILISQNGAGGIFFGLPTQATANGIFNRIRDWASKCDSELHSIRLAHGMTELNEEYQSMFHGTATDSGDENIIIHEWFEGRKQALLSDFVIATIDQFLLASLKQKHVMLRHLGLAGKVVILDECHAYDSYMNVYLDHSLTWLGAYKIPVIILSATLPKNRREKMIKAYLNISKKDAEIKVENASNSMSYPVLTYTMGDKIFQDTFELNHIPEKIVKCEELDEKNLGSYLDKKLHDGGCAAVIVNTVAYSQKLSEMLESELRDKNFEILCFHSRFVATDRAEIEKNLLYRVGKNSNEQTRNKLIVVGTQVLEQSLDLDFDVMVTELCPMDLLLQRSGRLHRHNRFNSRPSECKNPVLALLSPSEDKKNNIYSEWILEQTKRYLPEIFVIPSCIPDLIEKVYAEPKDEDAKSESYKKYIKTIKDKENAALKYCIKSNNLGSKYKNLMSDFINDDAGNNEEAEASVRDTDETIEVLVLQKKSDIHYGTISGDCVFNITSELDENEARKIACERLHLPFIFSMYWEETKSELKNLPARWQKSRLLKDEFLLLLDEKLEIKLLNRTLRYTRKRGLEEIKI